MKIMNMSPHNILLLVSFLDSVAVGMLLPQLTRHVNGLGANHIIIGFMGALYSGSQLVSAPIVGSLSDVRGRKPITLLCAIICSISYFYLGLTSSVFVVLVLRGVLGLVKQTQMLFKALAPDYVQDPSKQSEFYGKLASLSGIGMASGPILGGHIVEAFPEYGFTVITAIMGTCFAMNSGLVQLLPNIKKEKKEDDSTKPISALAPKLIDSIKAPLKESIDEFYKIDWPIYGDLFVFKLLMTLCMGMYFSNFFLFLNSIHEVSPRNLGYIISLQGVSGAICTYFIAHINKLYKNDKDFTERNYHVFIVVAATLLGLTLAPNVYIYTALLIPLAVGSSVGRVVSLEMLTRRTTGNNRGTVSGATNSVKSVSGIALPIISGLVNEYFGVVYSFLLAATFAAVGVVVSRRIRLESLQTKDK